MEPHSNGGACRLVISGFAHERERRSGGYVVAGIDVGGTFTDLILIDGGGGAAEVRIAKTPTTPDNQALGVVAALAESGFPLGEIDLIVHGTTTTTNAVLERRLARTGLITTRGFRDVLELGRRTRPQPYGMTGTFVPLIERNLRLEVSERIEASGRVRVPLDEDEMRAAVRRLLQAGCESLVIHFIHAYANPAHERRAAEIAAEIWPNDQITTGHSLLSEAREFERGVTAAVNASVQPILKRYVARLSDELAARGYRREFLVMNGNGGMISARLVADEAAKTVMSGPASGVMAAAYTARRAGFDNVVTYDMGGTSTDVALVRGARPAVSHEIEIEYAMPIHVPMVDVHSVGAGGGSIARLDHSGLIRIGPESAGAVPGPICYGRGGTEPTISDANLVLGRLNPKKLLSVDRPVAVEAVEAVFAEKIGARTGLDGTAAAGAVLKLANIKMAGAVRMVSLAKGARPARLRAVRLWRRGAAACHRTCPRAFHPACHRAGPARHHQCARLRGGRSQARLRQHGEPARCGAGGGRLRAILEGQRAAGLEQIGKETVRPEKIDFIHSADMQFIGQTHLITVPLPGLEVTRDELQALFEKAYFARFRVELPQIRAMLVNLNTSVIGQRAPLDLSTLIDPAGRAGSLAEAQTETRRVWFEAGGWQETPVYARERLPLEAEIIGPAILEQMDATTVMEPGDRARSDADGNLIIEVGRAE